MRRVVVTGLGVFGPTGHTAEATWKAAQEGVSGVGPITLFDVSDYAARIAAEVKGYDAKEHFNPKDIRKMDRFIQFCLIAAKEALENSGLDLESVDLTRVGANVGVGIGGLSEIERQHKVLLEKGPRRVSPFFVPMIINNLAAGQISIKYGLKGPNTCITTACSSSAHSVGESFRLIQRGDVDAMVAGGAEAAITTLSLAGFASAKALSCRNDEPTRASRPYDKDRDGFVMGEGAAVLILEEYEHAKKRGANIVCEITGYGLNADAFHMTAPSPEGEGASRCMELALKDAKVNPDDIDYANTHGTSTPLGDVIETMALKRSFGDWSKKMMVSSTKSMTGHLLGAAGALEAVFCALAIRDQIVPPTINLENPSPECADLDFVPNTARKARVRAAVNNSFGFGGTNACLVFKQV